MGSSVLPGGGRLTELPAIASGARASRLQKPPIPPPLTVQVEPFFSGLPPILWLRAVLRVYALADEKQMLQEVHDRLPAKASAAAGSQRHVVCHRGLEL